MTDLAVRPPMDDGSGVSVGVATDDARSSAPAVITTLRRAARPLTALGVAATVLLVQGRGLLNYPTLGDDEGTYASQAWAVRHGELAHYTYWYDHPPLGWIQLGAVDWLPQLLMPWAQPVAASRVVLCVVAAISSVLTLELGWRIGLRPPLAVVAALAAFLSPLSVTLQRQVYLDNLAVPWVLAAFVLVMNKRQRLWSYVGAGAAFGVAVLTKETTAVLLPLLVWAALRHSHPRVRGFCVTGTIGGVLVVTAYYPLLALLRGELLPGPGHVSLVGAMLFQFVDRSGSGAVWQTGSGSYQVISSWLYYDPWLIGVGLVGMVVCLVAQRTRLVAMIALMLTVVALKPSGYLPAMYVIVVLPFLGLCAAGALDVVYGVTRSRIAALCRRPGTPPLVWRAIRVLRLARVLPVVGLSVLLALAATAWSPGLAVAMTSHSNDDRVLAERWMAAHVPSDSVVLTDDVTWLGLVDKGIVERSRAIWFYKLDTDPAVERRFPLGWRDVDYVVSTDDLREAVAANPALAATARALANSTVVASFGSGSGVVQIRQVGLPARVAPRTSPGYGTSPAAGVSRRPVATHAPVRSTGAGRTDLVGATPGPVPSPASTAPPPFTATFDPATGRLSR